MQALGAEVLQIVEGAVGGVVIAALLAIALVQGVRWARRRRHEDDEPGTPGLARFVDSESTDTTSFGGGAWSARVTRRSDTVTYGYLAVAEEHASADTGGHWCTLTVYLPGRVPFLVADNRAAVGRVGVPLDAPVRSTLDDPPFDATYLVGAAEPDTITRVLTPAAREVLLRAGVQRLMLSDSLLLLRTVDGVRLDAALIAALDGAAARFLAATPSFVTVSRTPARSAGGSTVSAEPLPPGLYGPAPETAY